MSDLGTDLRPATQCVGLAIRRASRAVSQHYDDALRPTGLRNSQLSLLVALDQAGEISIGALADWLRMDRTTLTRNASVLEQRGLIGAREDENDRRSRILSITDEGRRAAGEAFPYWEKAQREIAALIGDESLAACVAGANALAERLGQQTA